MPEPLEIEAEVRRHGQWMEQRFVPLDPAEVRAHTDGGDESTTGDPARPPGSRRSFWLLAAAAVVVVVGLVGVLLTTRHDTDQGLQVVDDPAEPTDDEAPPAPPYGTWASLPGYELGVGEVGSEVHAIWTGSEVLLIGTMVAPSGDLGPIVAFDPDAGSWRTTGQAPVQLRASDVEVVWTGNELVITGPEPGASGPDTGAVGAAYSPMTDTWRTIAPAPPGKGVAGIAAWADGQVLFWANGAGVTAYDPTVDAWQELTVGGPIMNSTGSSAVWTGDELVVADPSSPRVVAFRPSDSSWRDLPERPASTVGNDPIVWTGTVLGVGDIRSPAWMAPKARAWERPVTTAPDGADSQPSAQVWRADQFLAWGGPGYDTHGTTPDISGTLGLDLVDGAWSRLAGPPPGEPSFTSGVLVGDRVFTWVVEVRPQTGESAIRAALSSPGFGSESPIDDTAVDDGSSNTPPASETTELEPDFGPPPPVVTPNAPVTCHWTRHTPPAEPIAPWNVEYVSSSEVDGVIAYRDVGGAMVPADWQRFCSTVTGPSP